jgi:cytochrome b6-f complex iron-sulfur subunit
MAATNLNKTGATNDSGASTPSRSSAMSRRALLTAGGVGVVAGVAVLSGCSPSTSAPATKPKSGTVLAKVSSVPVGSSFSAELDGNAIIISQPTEGSYTAFSAVCTHQGCLVIGQDDALYCPCHGSEFSNTTGDATVGPATTPLAKIEIKVDGDSIVVA